MTVNDKRGVLSRLGQLGNVTLEVGCGPHKRYANAIGIDAIDYEIVDVVGDALEVLRRIPDGVADLVTSYHFLEHVPHLESVLDEMIRVTRPGGRIEAVVPHFSHPYFYSDPTHVRHFGLYTFSYLAETPGFRRRVPAYSRRRELELRRADLIFKSTPPFYGRHVWKRTLGLLFNSCRYMQEFYEENLCYLFPCYEVRFVLEKVTGEP
jgi:SAM-dependent methyltransferase